MPIVFKAMSPSIVVGPQPPGAPIALHVTSVTSNAVSLAWTAPAGGATTYNLYRNGFKVATGIGTTTTVDAGRTPSTSYTYYVTGQNAIGEGPQSNSVVGTTSAAGTGVRFTPGHWLELDPNHSQASWITRIAFAKANGYKGVFLIQSMLQLETATAGVYTNGFATVDALINACVSNGMQLGIGWQDRSFTTATYSGTPPPSLAGLPAYYTTGQYVVAPSGAPFTGNIMGIALVSNAFHTGRCVAMGQAYYNRYGSTSNFEMWRGPESAIPAPSGGLNNNNYVTQLNSLYPQLRSAMPLCLLTHSPNFFGSVPLMQSLFAGFVSSGSGGLGPDQVIATHASSDLVHNGFSGNPSYVNVLPCIAEMQFPDVTQTTFTAQQVYDKVMTGDPSNGGSTKANYWLWFDWAGPPGNITTAAVIAAMPTMPVNSTRPSALP